MRQRGKPAWHQVALGIAASALVALVITVIVRQAWPPGEATYALDPQALQLDPPDIGLDFTQIVDAPLGPSQQSLHPFGYQLDYLSGSLRVFMVNSALNESGRAEIANWEQPRGFTPTNPPTIMGPFVSDHSGIFEVDSQVRSYKSVSSAHQDYQCCTYNWSANYTDWHAVSLQMGDEGDSGGGTRNMPTNPPRDDEEQAYILHWRHGPIVARLYVFGAHDITFAQCLRLATVLDQHISQALKSATKGVSNASATGLARIIPVLGQTGSAIHITDRRLDRWLHLDR